MAWEYITPSGDSAGYWADGAGDNQRISFDRPAELIDGYTRNKWAWFDTVGPTGGWVSNGQLLAQEDFALIPYSVRALAGNDPNKLLTGFQSSAPYIDEFSSYYPGVKVKGWDSARVDPERGLLLHYSDIDLGSSKAGSIVAGLIGSLFGPVAAGALAAGFSGNDVPGPFEIVKGGAAGYLGGQLGELVGLPTYPGIIETASLPSLSDIFSSVTGPTLTSTGGGVAATTAGAAAATGVTLGGVLSTLKDVATIGAGAIAISKFLDDDSPPAAIAPVISIPPAAPSAADKLLDAILGQSKEQGDMATAKTLTGNSTNAGSTGASMPAGAALTGAAIDWQPIILIAVAAAIALAFLDGKD